jgi:hypothetical protein
MAIDAKIDDGIATTGKVIGTGGYGSTCSWPGCNCINDGDNIRDGNVDAGENYDLRYEKEPQCTLLFSLGKESDIDMNFF